MKHKVKHKSSSYGNSRLITRTVQIFHNMSNPLYMRIHAFLTPGTTTAEKGTLTALVTGVFQPWGVELVSQEPG